MQTTWSQSLISGWLTASACAFLAGGIFRLRRRFAFWPALAVGSGVAGLALTRPFEGLVATVLSGAALLYWWSARGWLNRQGLGRLGRLVCVSSLPVGLALAAILAQNYATSGSLTRMPYQLHEQSYGVAPLFVFGHEKIGDVERAGELPEAIHSYHHGWSLDSFRRRMGLSGWLRGIQETWQLIWNYWFLFTAVSALTSPLWFRLRVPSSLAVMLGGQLLCSSCVCWIFPHYLSPMLPWLLALTIVGSRTLVHRLRHFPGTSASTKYAAWFAPGSGGWGRFLIPAILTLQVAWLGNAAQHLRRDTSRNWARQRAAIDADLRHAEGKHLVLVSYAPGHNVHQEWVYNRADLERDKVLWARDDRPEWTQRLLERYGHERYVWRLDPDGAAPELTLIEMPSRPSRTID